MIDSVEFTELDEIYLDDAEEICVVKKEDSLTLTFEDLEIDLNQCFDVTENAIFQGPDIIDLGTPETVEILFKILEKEKSNGH